MGRLPGSGWLGGLGLPPTSTSSTSSSLFPSQQVDLKSPISIHSVEQLGELKIQEHKKFISSFQWNIKFSFEIKKLSKLFMSWKFTSPLPPCQPAYRKGNLEKIVCYQPTKAKVCRRFLNWNQNFSNILKFRTRTEQDGLVLIWLLHLSCISLSHIHHKSKYSLNHI